jgi:OPA family sugar phosphate sensor protein UhpC-like MFS transporter
MKIIINYILKFFKAGGQKPPIKDKNEIDNLFSKHRKEVLIAIIFSYGFAYTCRLALSVVKKPLIDNEIFSITELGLVGSSFFYGYAFGKFFNGFLADHVNVKKFLSFGLIISGIINIIMGSVPSLFFWVALWGLNGWFQGFGAPSCAISLTNWFSASERGRYYGLWSSSHSIGEGLTFIGTATLVSFFSWKAGFIGPGITLIIVAFIAYYFLQDHPKTLGLPSISNWRNEPVNKSYTNSFSDIIKSQFQIIKIRSIWIIGLSSATMYITRYAINSWGILYLQEAKGFTLIEAGSLIGLNTFAGIIGCIAYGFISDKYFEARRPPVTFLFGLLEIGSLLLIFFGSPSTLTLSIGFIIYGFTLSGLLAVLGGLFAVDIAPKNATGAAMGFIGIFSYLGAAFQENISSHLIENSITVIGGETIYNFDDAIAFWVSASVVSLLLALSLWKIQAKD